MSISNNRVKTYCRMATELACLSNQKLSDLLETAKPRHSGIGGESVLLTMGDHSIFVKKLPLTDLEKQPENILSTANLFDLPLIYQYGIGSTGFGAWRELVVHIMTTNWVISGECTHFPMMYHWCILPSDKSKTVTDEQVEKLERNVKYWENSSTVRKRLEAIAYASEHIVLFLEYVPQTLHEWLKAQLYADENRAERAVLLVEKQMHDINLFMRKNELLHMDAHFENILTDGHHLYVSDFGLALSKKFELSHDAIEFFNNHLTYDQCSAYVNLLHCMITAFFGSGNWVSKLQEYIKRKQGLFPPVMDSVIRRYAPVSLVTDEFYENIQRNKTINYPAAHLAKLLITNS